MARLLILLALAALVAWWWYARQREQQRRRDLVAHARADFLNAAETEAAEEHGYRQIATADGRVRFRVPEAWREDVAGAGEMGFRDPASDERRLRLRVRTLERPGQAGREELAFLLGSLRPPGESVLAPLPEGRLLLKYVDAVNEAGRDLIVYTWQLARSVSADQARLAIFTLTVPAEAALHVLTRDDRRRIERAVRGAQVADA
jgi:hypothetical protein